MRVTKAEFEKFVNSRFLTQQVSPLNDKPIGDPYPTLSKEEAEVLYYYLNERFVLVDCEKLKQKVAEIELCYPRSIDGLDNRSHELLKELLKE